MVSQKDHRKFAYTFVICVLFGRYFIHTPKHSYCLDIGMFVLFWCNYILFVSVILLFLSLVWFFGWKISFSSALDCLFVCLFITDFTGFSLFMWSEWTVKILDQLICYFKRKSIALGDSSVQFHYFVAPLLLFYVTIKWSLP